MHVSEFLFFYFFTHLNYWGGSYFKPSAKCSLPSVVGCNVKPSLVYTVLVADVKPTESQKSNNFGWVGGGGNAVLSAPG